MPEIPLKLEISDGKFIAYHKTDSKENKPGVIFLSGFMSDMCGTKAVALEKYCIEKGYGFIRFDYFGHGQSSGKFVDGTIGEWKENVLAVLDKLTKTPQVLVGSSMGGWLMLLAALERPERIVGLVGIATAPDFVKCMIWDKMDEKAKDNLRGGGQLHMDTDKSSTAYPITMNFIDESNKHSVIGKTLKINCPVRFIHGMRDAEVPEKYSIMLGQQVTSDNMCVNLVTDGDHRLSSGEHIELICETLHDLIESLPSL